MEMKKYLDEEFKNAGLTISETQLQQFLSYYKLLVEWNKVMNLTAITDYKEVVIKHFVDSIIIYRYLDLSKALKVIDIGTGAGLPGIPLKIVFPNLNITLLDSLKKRISFLNTVIDQLGLDCINTIHGRTEDIAKKTEYREQYDICVSRAVANLSTLSEYCIPYVKVGGCFMAYKSGNSEEEIDVSKKSIKVMGGKINKVEQFYIPGTDISRCIVMVDKLHNTDFKYPRKAGIPGKKPIL